VHAKSPDISRQIVLFLCVEREEERKKNFAIFIIFLTHTQMKALQIFILKKLSELSEQERREKEREKAFSSFFQEAFSHFSRSIFQ
jgi:hypothetical protein